MKMEYEQRNAETKTNAMSFLSLTESEKLANSSTNSLLAVNLGDHLNGKMPKKIMGKVYMFHS